MVVNSKHIIISLAVLGLFQAGIYSYFDSAIDAKSEELSKKREVVDKLSMLESKWSKAKQKKELKRVLDFLSAFDVEYKVKELKKAKELTMKLKRRSADKIVSFILNRNLNIKSFQLEKVDKYHIQFKVVIS